MRRLCIATLLLLIGGCAGGPPPAPPVTASAPAAMKPPMIAAAPIARPVQPPAQAMAPSTSSPGSTDDFDVMLQSIAVSGGGGGSASRDHRALVQTPASATISTYPTAGRVQPAMFSYADNLQICLDGRWTMFCQHEILTPYDAAQVAEAEYKAIVAACLDGGQRKYCHLGRLHPSDAYRVQSAWLVTPETQFSSPSPAPAPATLQVQATPRVSPTYASGPQLAPPEPAAAPAPQQPAKVAYQPPPPAPAVGYTPPCSESGSCWRHQRRNGPAQDDLCAWLLSEERHLRAQLLPEPPVLGDDAGMALARFKPEKFRDLENSFEALGQKFRHSSRPPPPGVALPQSHRGGHVGPIGSARLAWKGRNPPVSRRPSPARAIGPMVRRTSAHRRRLGSSIAGVRGASRLASPRPTRDHRPWADTAQQNVSD